MTGGQTRFNLGWSEKDIKTAEVFLCYVLIPEWLGNLTGEMIFDRISATGLPLPKVMASAAQLASPRKRDDTEGCPHLIEARLIRHLQAKAALARYTLPEIVPSLTFRRWSRLQLKEEQRSLLLRAGGVRA